MFYEKCTCCHLLFHPVFLKKLQQIEELVDKVVIDDKQYYQLSNIVWVNDVAEKIKDNKYPSEYFVMIIMHTCVIDDTIVNPPIQLASDVMSHFSYIPFDYNKLLIIDALMKQGSQPVYQNDNEYIYSEHAGILSINHEVIDNIIVSAVTNRIDVNDNKIYLPVNVDEFMNYEYLFHTHPNTSTLAGRVDNGIIYEFPSANDLYNFVKYYNDGKTQASLIVTPEGIYMIRPISISSKINVKTDLFNDIKKFIIQLETEAIQKLKVNRDLLKTPEVFHKYVSYDFSYIKKYNKFIEPFNLFVEYYPRVKRDGLWQLRSISLPYIDMVN